MIFKDIIDESPMWIKNKYIDDLYGSQRNIINIVKSFQDDHMVTYNNTKAVENEIYLLSCTGTELDKFGDDYGFLRGSLNDTDYRNILLWLIRLSTIGGLTLDVLLQYITYIGYTVNNTFNMYYDSYNMELGGNANGDGTEDIIFTVSREDYRNFILFIELDDILTENDIIFIQNIIKNFHKLNNFIYIRSYF